MFQAGLVRGFLRGVRATGATPFTRPTTSVSSTGPSGGLGLSGEERSIKSFAESQSLTLRSAPYGVHAHNICSEYCTLVLYIHNTYVDIKRRLSQSFTGSQNEKHFPLIPSPHNGANRLELPILLYSLARLPIRYSSSLPSWPAPV